MNMRLGRIGLQEGVSVASIALIVSGIFTFEMKTLYDGGNSTYLTLPLAVLISLALFLAVAALMRRSGSKNLGELIKNAFGGFLSPILSVWIMLLLLFAAYAPLSQFVRAMHGLFYNGVSYAKLAAFVLPTVLILTLLGFETIGRTAKIYSLPLLAVFAASALASACEFEAYRLYPLLGNGFRGIVAQTVEEVGTFFPALLSLLIVADGLNGLETARRAGVISALIAAAVCFAAQLALSFVYTYKELGELFMPLFRINYLNKFEAHLMRVDKLAHMTWLSGGMLAGAFYIYCGSRLFAQSFEIRDIRPTLCSAAALTTLLILIELDSGVTALFAHFKQIMTSCGFLAATAPVLTAGMIAAIRKDGRRRKL